MSYQIATLIWVLLIIAVIISMIVAVGAIAYGFERPEEKGALKVLLLGVAMLFVTATIGWGIWAIYPLTAAGLG